jgi:hypothetical protein
MGALITAAIIIAAMVLGTGAFISIAAIKRGNRGNQEIKKSNRELKIIEMEKQQKILELEIEKQNNQIKLLEAENKELDKIIYENEKTFDDTR